MAGERVKLEVEARQARGSAESRRLRARGFVPGVLYGNGGEAQAFAVGERDLRRVLTGEHGTHAILDVVVGDGSTDVRHAVLKDYQLHPTRGALLHIDLHEVRLDRAIQAAVAVELVGEAEGAKAGGVLNQVAREVTVEALPASIPDRIHVDVSALEIGDNIRVADLAVPDGARIVDDEDTVVASVTQPTRVEVPEEVVSEEEAEAAEGVAPEEQPEGAASERAEPDADAAGQDQTVSG